MPDGNTPEHRTILTCVDVIIGTHNVVQTPIPLAQPLQPPEQEAAVPQGVDRAQVDACRVLKVLYML